MGRQIDRLHDIIQWLTFISMVDFRVLLPHGTLLNIRYAENAWESGLRC
jgi:hypothetical protein